MNNKEALDNLYTAAKIAKLTRAEHDLLEQSFKLLEQVLDSIITPKQ